MRRRNENLFIFDLIILKYPVIVALNIYYLSMGVNSVGNKAYL